MKPETNPFLSQEFHIRWSQLTPELMEESVSLALANADAAVEALAALPPETLTFANTILGLESATRELNHAWGRIEHLNAVANTPAFREAYNRLLPRVTAFTTSITLNPRLWAVLKNYAATPQATALTGPEKRLLDETLADFTENGADLADAAKTRLDAINTDLAALAQKYSENILDATNTWSKTVDDEALLDGLPPSARDMAAAEAEKAGRPGTWRFTLHAPSITPVLQYAKNDAFRRECWEAWTSIGGAGTERDNTATAASILALRHEKARLLGKKNFADFTTARRMAKTGDGALRFVEDLHDRIQTRFREETAELENFKAAKIGAAATPLAPWEIAYWAELQRREKHNFDPEELRPYLPEKAVLTGMFKLFGELLHIRVEEKTGIETWHPEVKFYEVFDAADTDGKGVGSGGSGSGGSKHLGSFYTDWHPREGKRGGAWMNHLITGGPRPDGSRAPHLGLICGNFSPALNGAEPLLSHDEALTIFHEFGHLLHHILSEAPYETLAGTRVAWDFVELPSQLLENWCWRKDGLDQISRHHKTGAKLPEALLTALTAAANYRAAAATMRQLAFAKLDLDLHIHHDELKARDFDDIWNNHLRDYQIPTSAPTPSMARRFTHIFGDPTGYAAGYYSYKWAEVLEADVFTRFLQEGVLNAATGRELREKIYAKGNVEPPEKLFHDFMGRAPDLNALLAREGLA
jgi:oligopeptidase A